MSKKIININDINDDETSGSGSAGGGQSGDIQFKDFLSNPENIRDDLLSLQEKNRLLKVHGERHEIGVKNQMTERADRKWRKENKTQKSNTYGHGGIGNSYQSDYKAHPALKDAAQFHGARDNKTNDVPTEYEANTNNAERAELKQRYELTHRPRYAPSSAPTLKRNP